MLCIFGVSSVNGYAEAHTEAIQNMKDATFRKVPLTYLKEANIQKEYYEVKDENHFNQVRPRNFKGKQVDGRWNKIIDICNEAEEKFEQYYEFTYLKLQGYKYTGRNEEYNYLLSTLHSEDANQMLREFDEEFNNLPSYEESERKQNMTDLEIMQSIEESVANSSDKDDIDKSIKDNRDFYIRGLKERGVKLFGKKVFDKIEEEEREYSKLFFSAIEFDLDNMEY
jgi:hypothetical protein